MSGYPDKPGHRGVDTSVAAATDLTARAPSIRELVYNAVLGASHRGGLTTEEVCSILDLPYATVQPRTSELLAEDPPRIMDSGVRRPNHTGKQAIVWVVPLTG